MITSKDVAKLAGVSHTTVSRAFRGDAKIKPETYDRIMKVSQELGYSPNMIASSLRQKNTKTLGFIISHGFNPLFLEITHLIETELALHGYRLLISFDDGEPEKQWNIIQSLVAGQVNAIIFSPLIHSPADHNRLYSLIQHSQIHFIQLISNHFEDITSFRFDDNYGSYLGTRHLLSNGHNRILMIGGTNRVEGYIKAYQEKGLTPPISYSDLTGDIDEVSYRNIKEAILREKPTAVFPISESLSYITYQVLSDLSIQIPSDISFLSFDDERWLQLLHISVIGHPVQALSSVIVREILSYEKAAGEVYPSATNFKPFLIERNSIQPYKAD